MASRGYYMSDHDDYPDSYRENKYNGSYYAGDELRGRHNFGRNPPTARPTRIEDDMEYSRHTVAEVEYGRQTVSSHDHRPSHRVSSMRDPYYPIEEVDMKDKGRYDDWSKMSSTMAPHHFDSPRRVEECRYPPQFDPGYEKKYDRLTPYHEDSLRIRRDDPYDDQYRKQFKLGMPKDALVEVEQQERHEEKLRGGGGGSDPRGPGSTNSSSSSKQTKIPMIEIEPGWFAPLRGTKETYEAVKRDFFVPTECYCCASTVFCIQDADFMLCPNCVVVIPISIENGGGSEANGGTGGGVGLGFTMNHLANWQQDIQRERDDAIQQRIQEEKRRFYQQEQDLADMKRKRMEYQYSRSTKHLLDESGMIRTNHTNRDPSDYYCRS